jgi:hypothetical protein
LLTGPGVAVAHHASGTYDLGSGRRFALVNPAG